MSSIHSFVNTCCVYGLCIQFVDQLLQQQCNSTLCALNIRRVFVQNMSSEFMHMHYLPIFLWVTSLALGKSCSRLSASEAILFWGIWMKYNWSVPKHKMQQSTNRMHIPFSAFSEPLCFCVLLPHVSIDTSCPSNQDTAAVEHCCLSIAGMKPWHWWIAHYHYHWTNKLMDWQIDIDFMSQYVSP